MFLFFQWHLIFHPPVSCIISMPGCVPSVTPESSVGGRSVSFCFITFLLLLLACLANSRCSEIHVNVNVSRTMGGEQRGSLYLWMTLNRILTLSLSLPITKMSLIIYFSNTSRCYPKAYERECMHKTLWEMEKQHKVDLPSQKVAKTWCGSLIPGGWAEC